MFKEGKSDAHEGNFSRNETIEQRGEAEEKYNKLFENDYFKEAKEGTKEQTDIPHRLIQPLEAYKRRADIFDIPMIDKYEEVLSDRLDKADETALRLYERYGENSFNLANGNYKGTAHYNPMRHEINLNIKVDIQNPLGPGSIYFHELGHVIDHLCGDDSGKYLSERAGFRDAILRDVNNYIEFCKYV